MSSTVTVGTDVSASEIFDVIANDRRRALLSVLPKTDTAMSVSTLAARLAEYEQAPKAGRGLAAGGRGRRQDSDSDAVDQLESVLHHRHLPKLADAGLVEYAPETKRVIPTPLAEDINDAVEELTLRLG